ncbi:hypothetical protein RRG08_046664 [Elysia crispata]|uniref:Uncharacterized protein n=1 Tax=Elysia crispata TaxID=231223 RepID=A0AAE1BBP0_9GAST|nr:hypothetical protein RRG08_046664 [Elysia crispata]
MEVSHRSMSSTRLWRAQTTITYLMQEILRRTGGRATAREDQREGRRGEGCADQPLRAGSTVKEEEVSQLAGGLRSHSADCDVVMLDCQSSPSASAV